MSGPFDVKLSWAYSPTDLEQSSAHASSKHQLKSYGKRQFSLIMKKDYFTTRKGYFTTTNKPEKVIISQGTSPSRIHTEIKKRQLARYTYGASAIDERKRWTGSTRSHAQFSISQPQWSITLCGEAWSITRSDLLVRHLQFGSCGYPRRTSAAGSSLWL